MLMWCVNCILCATKTSFIMQKTKGRPKVDPSAVRISTSVRLSSVEYDLLKEKSAAMGMAPSQWLRVAALSRRLPSMPVPAINREQASELKSLSDNLSQLVKQSNNSQPVVVNSSLLGRLIKEVVRLRLAILGKPDQENAL